MRRAQPDRRNLDAFVAAGLRLPKLAEAQLCQQLKVAPDTGNVPVIMIGAAAPSNCEKRGGRMWYPADGPSELQPGIRCAITGHAAILEAIERRDPTGARAAMTAHLAQAAEVLAMAEALSEAALVEASR